jgi:uncharacterized membrane protein
MSLVKPNLPRSQRIPKWWLGTVAALGFVGFLDAVYLTAKHYTGFEITCSLVHGCEQVLTSQFATVFGILSGYCGVCGCICRPEELSVSNNCSFVAANRIFVYLVAFGNAVFLYWGMVFVLFGFCGNHHNAILFGGILYGVFVYS